MPFKAYVFGTQEPWVLKQDNRAMHSSIFSRNWMPEKSDRTLSWLHTLSM